MPRPPRLDDAEVAARLSALPGWTVEEGKLHQTFTFRDFPEAWRFMTAVAQEAEALDHHPEWLNIYSRVTVDLITHDAGGSDRGREVAQREHPAGADDPSDRDWHSASEEPRVGFRRARAGDSPGARAG